MLGIWGARDLLHTHRDLSARHDCPACRVERTAGVTSTTAATLVVLPTRVVLEVLPDLHAAGRLSQGAQLEPPARSPPLPS